MDAGDYADEMLELSAVTGISTDKLQAYNYAAELVDVSLDTLTGSMAKNIKSMTSAAKGTGSAAEAYKALGISVVDSEGNLRDSETVFWEAVDALGQIEDQTQRDSLSMSIFGKSAQDLNPLILAGKEQLTAYTEEAKKMGAVLSDDQLTDLGAFDDSVQRLKSGANAVKNALGTVLMPELKNLADSGTQLLGEFTKGIADANGDWNKISKVIGSTIGKIAKTVFEKLPDLITLGGQILVSVIPEILPSLELALQKIMELIFVCFPIITQSLFTLIGDIATWLAEGDNATQLVNGIVSMVSILASQFSELLPILLPAIVEILSQIALALTSAENIKLLITAVLQIATAIFVALVNTVPVLIDFIKDSILNLADLFSEFLLWIVPKVASGIEKLVNTVKSWGDKAKEFVFGLIDNIRNAITDWIVNIKLKITTGFKELVSKVSGFGSDMVAGIWSSISKSYDWIKGKIKEWVGNVTDFFKKALGINSPSKVLANAVGKWMPSGIASGFEKAMPAALSDMKNTMSDAVSDLKTDVALQAQGMLGDVNISGSSSGSIGGSSSPTINFNQTINSPKAVDGMTLYRETNSLLFTAKVRLGNV